MMSQPASRKRAPEQEAPTDETERRSEGWLDAHALADGEMACPVCSAPMPDLKGGKATICPNCGFKDSCCY